MGTHQEDPKIVDSHGHRGIGTFKPASECDM